jgi:hypothetical protein
LSNIFDEIAGKAADLRSAPSDEQIARLRSKCEELVEAESRVAELDSMLESAREKKNALAHKELPEIFGLLEVDNFGLPNAGEFGVDLILSPYFKASIPAEWEEEKKNAAFDHLELIGGGDIIRTEVKFSLGRGQTDLARKIAEFVADHSEELGSNDDDSVTEIPPATISMGVPWNSLTSFVKERHRQECQPEFLLRQQIQAERGEPIEPNMNIVLLNATVGEVVKIKPRKEKK